MARWIKSQTLPIILHSTHWTWSSIIITTIKKPSFFDTLQNWLQYSVAYIHTQGVRHLRKCCLFPGYSFFFVCGLRVAFVCHSVGGLRLPGWKNGHESSFSSSSSPPPGTRSRCMSCPVMSSHVVVSSYHVLCYRTRSWGWMSCPSKKLC